MPVVTVSALPHGAERELLQGVADAVGRELGLGPGDVIALAVPVRAAVANGQDPQVDEDWAVIGIHGSDRGEERMRAACDAAGAAATDWSGRHGVERGVWCEWVLPQQR